MKKFLGTFLASLILAALTVISVSAKSESATLEVIEPTTVGGVVLDKGHYTFKFDDKTSEVTVIRDGKKVTTVKATVVAENRKFQGDSYTTKATDSGRVLTSIRFNGQNRSIVLGDATASN